MFFYDLTNVLLIAKMFIHYFSKNQMYGYNMFILASFIFDESEGEKTEGKKSGGQFME